MKKIATMLLAEVICLLSSAIGQGASRKVFLLQDPQQHQWCAYTQESQWTSDVKSADSLTIATVEYSGGHISKIDLTENDEAGDWVVYDHYSTDGRGQLHQLKRTVNILPGDRTEDVTYLIQNGKARSLTHKVRSLSTKEPLAAKNREEWLPKVLIVKRLEDFPFFPLLSKTPTLRPNGKVCLAEH